MPQALLKQRSQAKESADDLVAAKKEIDAQVEAKKKEAREFEIKMRQKAGTIGNIVGKNAPVSLTEVSEDTIHQHKLIILQFEKGRQRNHPYMASSGGRR